MSSSTLVFAQKQFLQAGPMNGYVTFREAAIWVQTTESAKVTAVYWTADNPTKKKSDDSRNYGS